MKYFFYLMDEMLVTLTLIRTLRCQFADLMKSRQLKPHLHVNSYFIWKKGYSWALTESVLHMKRAQIQYLLLMHSVQHEDNCYHNKDISWVTWLLLLPNIHYFPASILTILTSVWRLGAANSCNGIRVFQLSFSDSLLHYFFRYF